MTNRNKAKGSRWEARVRDYLSDALRTRVERIPAGAQHDRGDLSGIPGMAVECKDVARMDLAGWVDEATDEALNVGGGTLPVVIHKRRGKGTSLGYVTMPLWAFAELLKRDGSGG